MFDGSSIRVLILAGAGRAGAAGGGQRRAGRLQCGGAVRV